MLSPRLAGIATALIAAAPLCAYDVPGFTPNQIIEYKQTVDGSGNPVGLDLHLFYPEGHQPADSRPAIVFFFGGGWVSGSPTQFHPHCEYLASRGIVAASAEYRVSGVHGTTPQECVKDGKSALRFLRENAAALGIDPNRIAAGGGSAGGQVAAATGTLTAYEEPGENLGISSKPNALVLFNPVIDNGPGGYGHNTVQAYWEDFSPLHNIDATAPPTVFFLGTADDLIPVATAESYQSAMEAAGLRCDLHLYQDQPHGFFNYEVPDDGSGPWYGYQATVFRMDEFLVSLGYLDDPHAAADPVTGWVALVGDAGFSGGSEATASPVTTDADADAIAANIDPLTLADGEFLRLIGSVTFDAPIPGGQFRIGLFDGDDPVTAGDGSGYAGIWAEAPATADTKIAVGDGSAANPFDSGTATQLGPMPAADLTVPASTEIAFTLMIARNGGSLDISAAFTDGGGYFTEQNLLNQPLTNFSYNSVAFLMGGTLNATQGSYSNVAVTRGQTLPSSVPSGAITYVDAVEGASGNTFATGGSPGDISWVDLVTNGANSIEDRWMKRTGTTPGNEFGNGGGTVFQAAHNATPVDEMPEITTRITGLADGTYTIWAFYWDNVASDTQNWTISTGLTSGSLTNFSSPGEPAVAGATTAGVVDAGSLSFTDNVLTIANAGSPTGERRMFGVYLGEVSVSGGSGTVDVYVDNLLDGANGATLNRTWFDGVGYQAVADVVETSGSRVLAVDFNRGDTLGAPSQSGFRTIPGSTTQANNSPSYTKTIGGHTVTITQPDGINFEFRGANGDSSRDIPGGDTSRSFLVADFIGTRQGTMDIEIDGLAAGDYLFRSYHLDTFNGSNLGFAQGLTPATPNRIEALLGLVLMDSVEPTGLGAAGLGTTFIDDDQIPTLEFPIRHDGSSPLTIKLRSTRSNGTHNFLLLNGFEINRLNP